MFFYHVEVLRVGAIFVSSQPDDFFLTDGLNVLLILCTTKLHLQLGMDL